MQTTDEYNTNADAIGAPRTTAPRDPLAGMTHARWIALTPELRAAMRDTSQLHPQLIGLEGKRVRVSPAREHGRSTFRVGITTGWRPAYLAMRAGSCSSSDIIRADERFDSITVLP